MAGTGIRVEVQGLARVNAELGRIGNADLRPLLDALGFEVEGQTKRRIDEEKSAPDGTPWAPLSPEYQAWKQDKKGAVGLLEFEGHLLKSIQYQFVGANAVEIGTNMIYGAIHQSGGDDVGKNIPARPYLGLSDENVDDLVAVTRNFVEGLLQ